MAGSPNLAFAQRVLKEFIPDRDASLLVCGSAATEKELLAGLGYTDVRFTGMDLREKVQLGQPTLFENAEALTFANSSFDYVFVKDTVHHTSLPHKVLTELFRVARKGFLVIEGRDSALIRVAARLGLTEQFEVHGNFKGHGVNGTDIPNHIFRWTEREVEKTLKSFAPQFHHRVTFRYHSNYPTGRNFSTVGKVGVVLLRPAYWLFTGLFPKQQNIMAFFVEKPTVPDDLKPWLRWDPTTNEIVVDREWIKKAYHKRLSR